MHAAVLIGGASKRMGRPKALIPIQDLPAFEFLARLLDGVTGKPTALVGQMPQNHPPHNRQIIPDRQPGSGPLSALLGLYAANPSATYLVLACDLFNMREAPLKWLIQLEGTTRKTAIWPLLQGRPFGEPLAAIYTPAAFARMAQSWTNGQRGLHRALPVADRWEPAVPRHFQSAFHGANNPAELALREVNPGEGR